MKRQIKTQTTKRKNHMKNHIVDITIAAESLTTINAATATLNTQIDTFGIHLDESERKHSQKIGTRNESFAREMLDFAAQRPDLMPGGISVTALQRDRDARDQLTPILFQLQSLLRTLEDTHTALGVDFFNGTRALYKAVKPIAEINGVQDIVKQIGERFAGQGRRKSTPVPTTPEISA
jgi:hypothetical protein